MCPFCKTHNVKKIGFQNKRQKYLCKSCKKYFQNSLRESLLSDTTWNLYVNEKRILTSLAREQHVTVRTIQNRIDAHLDKIFITNLEKQKQLQPGPVVLVVDTMYYAGRSRGVMVARDVHRCRTIGRRYVRSENLTDLSHLINGLMKAGWEIQALVVDGRRGVFQLFPHLPIQMCQFHQMQIVTRYLTTRPVREEAKELRQIALQIPTLTEVQYTQLLQQWQRTHELFLKEKTTDPLTKKWHYTHRKVRSAFFSMRRNTPPYLFTFQKDEYQGLQIPNTTNAGDGFFSQLRDHLRIHRGLRRMKMVKLIETVLWS